LALERVGATVIGVEEPGFLPAIRVLARRGIQSVLLEGGAALHAAAWDEGAVDYVQLYIAPVTLGSAGVPLLEGRSFSTTTLVDRRVSAVGPDVVIEGYVHRPR
jgi:diaminohydroxyphosphoribosylaminopyrimidine deaminase/5-amino-6-(5-phosphoribosylamino)uracil reductase